MSEPGPGGRPLRVLSLALLYPRPDAPLLGPFVRSRLLRLAELADVRVLAPVPCIEWNNPRRKLPDFSLIPPSRADGALAVLHPRWLYVPGVAPLLPAELAIRLAPVVRSLRRSFDFDVIDAHFGYPAGVAAAILSKLSGRPFVVTLRGSETVHAKSASQRALIAWSLKKAARIVALSRPLAEFACSLGADPDRCTVIPNGIDNAIFHPRDRQACRTRLGMREDRLHILSAGHRIELKGHHRVVTALPALLEAGIPAELWIVGGAGQARDFTPAIEESIRRCGVEDRVHLSPGVPPDELADYMSAADVCCLASASEGWPNVVSETLACGTPVVATRVGAVPEQLPGERFGITVPPLDQEALNEALAAALRRRWDRAAIAEWGRGRSWDQTAREALAVLRAAAAEW